MGEKTSCGDPDGKSDGVLMCIVTKTRIVKGLVFPVGMFLKKLGWKVIID